jgi:predicted nucleic acid-binding protein
LTLDVTEPVSREAGELAERYALRGFDALHLASFAEIARKAGPAKTRFSSFDDRLNKASRDVARRLQSGR